MQKLLIVSALAGFLPGTPLHASIAIQLAFGTLTDNAATAIPDGCLWIMVYDENDDGSFPGGLQTNSSVTDSSAAHNDFAGVELAVGTTIAGDRIIARGEVDSASSGIQGVLFDQISLTETLAEGRKWALYWFPGLSLSSPTAPASGGFVVGGLNEMSNSSGNDTGMLIPANASQVSTGEFDTAIAADLGLPPGSGLPAARFQAISATPGSSDDFDAWIASFSVGGLTGFDDDFDMDGLGNGTESALGSAPDTANTGLTGAMASSGALQFTTTLAKSLPSDVTRSWEWSTDLTNWYDADGPGDGTTTVDFDESVIDGNNPDFNVVEITATPSNPVPGRIFARLAATQSTP